MTFCLLQVLAAGDVSGPVLSNQMLAELKRRQFTQLPVIDCRTMTVLKGWAPMKMNTPPPPPLQAPPEFVAQMQAQTQWAQHHQQQQQQLVNAGVPPLHPAQMQAHVAAKINQVIYAHQLFALVPPDKAARCIANVCARVRFTELAGMWRLPEQMFGDLSSLCLYDTLLLVDDSACMAGALWQECVGE